SSQLRRPTPLQSHLRTPKTPRPLPLLPAPLRLCESLQIENPKSPASSPPPASPPAHNPTVIPGHHPALILSCNRSKLDVTLLPRMILFPVYALFVWYLCLRWRRTWIGWARLFMGVAGVA